MRPHLFCPPQNKVGNRKISEAEARAGIEAVVATRNDADFVNWDTKSGFSISISGCGFCQPGRAVGSPGSNRFEFCGQAMTVPLSVLCSIDTMKKTPPTANIQITKDGPYLVNGAVPLCEQHIVTNAEGESLDYRDGKKYPAQQQYALCRCGQSANKPFCDGTHKRNGFRDAPAPTA